MTTTQQYARALFDLIEERPQKGATFLTNLQGVLARRGHTRLLPNIFNEYRKLALRQERALRQSKITPEQERNRHLLELYRKLISTQ